MFELPIDVLDRDALPGISLKEEASLSCGHKDFVSAVTQRRSAMRLNLNQKTIARKLKYLGERARLENAMDLTFGKKSPVVEFDKLVDKEDLKCKPLSVPLVVESKLGTS